MKYIQDSLICGVSVCISNMLSTSIYDVSNMPSFLNHWNCLEKADIPIWILVLIVVCAAPITCGNKVGRTEGTDFNLLFVWFTVNPTRLHSKQSYAGLGLLQKKKVLTEGVKRMTGNLCSAILVLWEWRALLSDNSVVLVRRIIVKKNWYIVNF